MKRSDKHTSVRAMYPAGRFFLRVPIAATLFKTNAAQLSLLVAVFAFAAPTAIGRERVYGNSRVYFTKVATELTPHPPRPAFVHLTCDPEFIVAGYRFVPPVEPIVEYPDNWAPITVLGANDSNLNDWVLELFNSAEPPRPPYPLTIAFACADITP